MMAQPLSFQIALTALKHLGPNLYRNFITVLGEAISNSWDAGAKNVWIDIDRGNKFFSITDDGIGMSGDDFRNKFLNVGYSRREDNKAHIPGKRPLIGGKGIGKLALLSCAQRIHITSTKNAPDYIGGIIDNNELNKAIKNNLPTQEYGLLELEDSIFKDLKKRYEHKHGTIFYFQNTNNSVNNKEPEVIEKLIALHFRLDLIIERLKDDSFSIHVNGEEINFNTLKGLSKDTQFVWNINKFVDPFLKTLQPEKDIDPIDTNKDINGFIASVKKPSHLKIFGNTEKVGVDVFVNGRLRETNILKHAPTFETRVVASYLYGQIHLNTLDNASAEATDKFPTSREGIQPEDEVYQDFLRTIETKILSSVSTRWDEWRRKEKSTIPRYLRLASESNIARKKEFEKRINKFENMDEDTKTSLKMVLDRIPSTNTHIYHDLFILENLFRKFLEINRISDEVVLQKIFPSTSKFKRIIHELLKYKNIRANNENGHILIRQGGKIVKREHDLNYLNLVSLGVLVDEINAKKLGVRGLTIKSDTTAIKPVRDAVMHTNEVSQDVKDWDKIKNLIDILDKLDARL